MWVNCGEDVDRVGCFVVLYLANHFVPREGGMAKADKRSCPIHHKADLCWKKALNRGRKKHSGSKPFDPCDDDYKILIASALENPNSRQGKICWVCDDCARCARKAGQVTGGEGGDPNRSHKNSF